MTPPPEVNAQALLLPILTEVNPLVSPVTWMGVGLFPPPPFPSWP
jgi:hypothetical protein